MLAVRSALSAFLALSVLLAPVAFAKEPAKPPAKPAPAQAAAKLRFQGVDYLHRWSKQGQNEFTPTAQPDLETWRDMVTVVVNERVTTGDQLATLANNVLDNYTKAGDIVRTDSKPRTGASEAEHFIAAMLRAPNLSEAVFARVFLHEGKGVVLVYSRRAYGAKSSEAMGSFLVQNGEATERALMTWTGTPKLATLRALPQAK